MWKKCYPAILAYIRDGKTYAEFERDFKSFVESVVSKKSMPIKSTVVSTDSRGQKTVDWNLVVRSKIVILADSTFDNIGPRGVHPSCVRIECYTASELRDQCEQFPENHSVKCVIAGVGINNLKHGSWEGSIQEIQSCLSLLQNKLPDASIMYSSMLSKRGYKLFDSVTSANAEMKRFCGLNHVIFIDNDDILQIPALIPDGIHPSPKDGATALANNLRNHLPRYLSPRLRRSHSQPRRGGGAQRGGPRGRGSRKTREM